MRKYYYYLCDPEIDDDTIANNNLKKLYNVLFDYCELFSVIYFTSSVSENVWIDCEKMNYFSELSSLATEVISVSEWPGHRDCKYQAVMMFLPCNDRTRILLEQVADDIRNFVGCWGLNNPEDIAFYRSDGSAMFYSTIHECIFHLNADNSEDVTEILSLLRWSECDQEYHDTKKWF